ncbi:hypothetical protein [Massilia aquatica]|uniref:DUF3592 domain-containing protein n=1 Tax=Massilia aquatica TaxID=2609000 RepID=A0ABX0LXW1_9BURK|nr:hypothetical protein [Massilia aquatica]NHZ39293.1 hypothetical protein [Massilia aquatica]
MTIFDGMRRVVAVLSCIAVIAAAAVIWNEKPFVEFIYEIDGVDKPPVSVEFCEFNVHGGHSMRRETDDGRTYRVTLCFLAHESADGRMLVEYKNADGLTGRNIPRSDEVQQYMRRTGELLVQTPAELLAAKKELDKQRRSYRVTGAIFTLAVLLFFWLFMQIVGVMINSMPALRNNNPGDNK